MPHIKQKIPLSVFAGITGVMLTLTPAYSNSENCALRSEMVEKLNERFGESRQSVGLTPGGQALEIFAHPEEGTWTILLTLPNGTSCMMASGHEYQVINDPSGQDV